MLNRNVPTSYLNMYMTTIVIKMSFIKFKYRGEFRLCGRKKTWFYSKIKTKEKQEKKKEEKR